MRFVLRVVRNFDSSIAVSAPTHIVIQTVLNELLEERAYSSNYEFTKEI